MTTQTTVDRIAQEYREYAATELMRHNAQIYFSPCDANDNQFERVANALHIANALESVSDIRSLLHRIAGGQP